MKKTTKLMPLMRHKRTEFTVFTLVSEKPARVAARLHSGSR
jgi:hypothetical protein